MTRLKELVLFSVGLLVGWFAWMVAGPKPECPPCLAAVWEGMTTDVIELTNVEPLGKGIILRSSNPDVINEVSLPNPRDSGLIDFRIVYVPSIRSENVEELERAYDAAQATITELRGGYAEQVLTYQKQIEQLESDIRFKSIAFGEIVDERDRLKQALKQLRTDYITLANKNAALERASIEELAKSHKNGEKVSKRELPPIMQAVVDMGGVPSGKQAPRPVLP